MKLVFDDRWGLAHTSMRRGVINMALATTADEQVDWSLVKRA